jgi:hypothetical protein
MTYAVGAQRKTTIEASPAVEPTDEKTSTVVLTYWIGVARRVPDLLRGLDVGLTR